LSEFPEPTVISCQRFVRKFLHRKRLATGRAKPVNMKELVFLAQTKDAKEFPEKKKNRFYWVSIREIIQTEESYVADLSIIISHYMEPLFGADQIVKTSDIQVIFGNISSIYEVSKQFLNDLKEGFYQLQNGDSMLLSSMGKLLEKLPIYAQYYVNFDKSNSLRQKLKENSKYNSFLQALQEASPSKQFDLDSYLIKPCQRVPRYKLLVDAVIKNMSDENIQKPKYQMLLERIDSIVHLLNEKKRDDENRQKVISIAEKLNCPNNFTLVTPNRRYVYHGPLGVLSPKSLKHQWKTGRSGYLFSDILLVARSRYLSSSDTVMCIVDLRNVTLQVLPDTAELFNCFVIQQGDLIVHFITETVESKETWLTHIRQVIEANKA